MEQPKHEQSYYRLMAEFYDQLFELDDEEYQFYRYFMHELPGHALELACGTGQFLLGYLDEELVVDGLDSSSIMLARAERKAQKSNLAPRLYQSTMQDFTINQRYTTLYIPSCSFMLLTERAQAHQALRRFYEHLIPGGQLLVSLFNPWHERDQSSRAKLRRDFFHNAHRILFYETFRYKPIEQLRQGFYRFETYQESGMQLAVELYEFWWRWYGRYEFEMMLAQAGFSDITIYSDYTLQQVSTDTDSPVLIFRARK